MGAVVDVVVPAVGESVSEGAIGRWFYKDGDIVEKDKPLFELDSDKASMEVTASESGKLKILATAGETVKIGATVAKIDVSEKISNGNGAGKSKKTASSPQAIDPKAPKVETLSATPEASLNQEKWEDTEIRRFTPSQRKAIRHGEMKPNASTAGLVDDEKLSRSPMSSLRRTIAQRLLHSQQSTATLTTFNEIDMSQLLSVRNELKDEFQKKFEIKLGFMSFFSAAVVAAIKDYPLVNSHIDGSDIVAPSHINLGIAVSTDRGLVVPVIRRAESLSYAQLENAIAGLADKARNGKLSIPEMQGGTFTLTNGGVFGSLLSTPILNPPQSGILGMHKTEHRPMAIQKKDGTWSVEVRPMMYVALSYDHRLIDGATSVGFLIRVKDYIENVTKELVMA
ncbi:MAG: dihydrolipoyllysine-residue succinyltransferase [Deltaproteobacteria bacterium CG11_big_fil_rev_8_21_14_0_20_45_16]|nr:MAG: dihydrolipoyllysine-residue succinyltransferase [Deltaproteobacteria bacterium CG11_big_fil_rev_8_21_14_0_20_45_16]